MKIKTTLKFCYVREGTEKPNNKEIENIMLCLRDDVIGWLEHKRPFPAHISTEILRVLD